MPWPMRRVPASRRARPRATMGSCCERGCPSCSRGAAASRGSIPKFVRVLPKYRTPYGGITSRSISRYVCVFTPAVGYGLHRVRAPRRDSVQDRLNVLLLPWPLRVSAEDFRPLTGSVHERAVEPYGFFEFQPAEPFDLSLVEGLLVSASEHVDEVDVVVLPESSVPHDRVADLEALLARKGVSMLIAGIRDEPSAANSLRSNWVHFGAAVDGEWSHYRQDKHHRWSLDRSQIQQYHLEDVLDPRVRWWEAIEINPRSVQMIERDDGHTIAALDLRRPRSDGRRHGATPGCRAHHGCRAASRRTAISLEVVRAIRIGAGR